MVRSHKLLLHRLAVASGGHQPTSGGAMARHDAATTLRDYAHVIAELDPTDRTPAVSCIQAARKAVPVTSP